MIWDYEKVGALLLATPYTSKIKSSEYLTNGTTPVVDQSKNDVAGYTNALEARFETPLPVVLFGDHTRVLKYLDSPFARGADGTQILVTDSRRVIPRYFYYALHTVDLSSYGYARHFKYLKEQLIPIPPLDFQQEIADKLSTYDKFIRNNKRRMKLLEEAIHILYRKWFVYLHFPGHDRINFVDGVPKGWKKCNIGEILTKFPRRNNVPKNTYLAVGPIPTIDQSTSFIGGYTNDFDALYDSPLPLIIFGDHTRSLKFIDFPFARGADGTQVLHPKPGTVSPHFFYFALKQIDLSAFGYARHFKYLKAESIFVPPQTIVDQFDEQAVPAMKQLSSLRLQNQRLREARDLLLHRLINRRGLYEVNTPKNY
jgi:type I restriction enzyme, S subunit